MEKVNNFLNHVLPKILSVILVFLIFTSMIDSNLIQGCARVVNYTASVRGGSQRIVKLVIMGQPYSDLINESEIILNELKMAERFTIWFPCKAYNTRRTWPS